MAAPRTPKHDAEIQALAQAIREAVASECRRCGHGCFPFDQQAGLTGHRLTPGLERVVTLAGTVAGSFAKGAELVEAMAGPSFGETTVGQTAEDAGRRLAEAVQAGQTFGPKAVWPWHKDYDGQRCA
jgi:hypothetical protein